MFKYIIGTMLLIIGLLIIIMGIPNKIGILLSGYLIAVIGAALCLKNKNN